jgi:cytochrome c553
VTRAFLFCAGAALVVAAVVLSGVIPVKASSGHLAVTSWVLDFAKRRSVTMRARPIEEPGLDDPALVRLGAAHFETGCRPCHGAPGLAVPVVPQRMTPHPPDLARQVGRWRPRELFYLVAHGIKFTGMPAWPSAARTDEAWAIVAFLRQLPALDAAGYRALAGPLVSQSSTAAETAVRCRTCHHDASTVAPRLSGQSVAYLSAALDAYAGGQRHSGIMQPIAAALESGARRQQLAEVLSGPDPPVESTPPAPPSDLPQIIAAGDPARDVPACRECHGPVAGARDPRYPSLAGQSAAFLRLQLTLFKEGRRGGSSYGEVMRAIAVRLSPAQVAEAATAYAALPGVR